MPKAFLWSGLATSIVLATAFTTSANEFSDGVAAMHAGDYLRAVAIYKKLADQGNPDAQTNLGLMYASGRGVPQDFSEAVRWWQRAAAQGNTLAEGDLGESLHYGRGIAKDRREARKWLYLSATAGNPGAQFDLGLMYAKGEGEAPNTTLAYVWFAMAAKKGVQPAISDQAIARQHLNAAELQRAEALASRCEASNFKQCSLSNKAD
jgi:TPR repeat protein